MKLIKSLFWNKPEQRIRALWRIIIYLLIVAVLVNPIILLLDNGFEYLLNQTTTNFIVAAGFICALLLFIRYVDKSQLGDYGISLNINSLKILGMGAFGGALLVSVLVTLLWGLNLITFKQSLYSNPASNWPFFVLLTVQGIRFIFGSIFEELFSRAFLIRHIAEGIRIKGIIENKSAMYLACFITSLLFGFLHLANPDSGLVSTFNLSLIGLLFAFSYVFSGNISWPIGIHFGWNVFQNNVFGFANSGKSSEVSMVTFDLLGSNYWTGGNFGLEGSLLTTMTLILVLALLLYQVQKTNPSLEPRIYLSTA